MSVTEARELYEPFRFALGAGVGEVTSPGPSTRRCVPPESVGTLISPAYLEVDTGVPVRRLQPSLAHSGLHHQRWPEAPLSISRDQLVGAVDDLVQIGADLGGLRRSKSRISRYITPIYHNMDSGYPKAPY